MKQRAIICMLLVFLTFYNTGCSEANPAPKDESPRDVNAKNISPKDVFQIYLDAWQKYDYATMYQAITQDSKKLNTQEEFAKRYEAIYKGIGASNLSVAIDDPKSLRPDNEGKVNISYTVKLNSVAGEINFSSYVALIEEAENDKKQWRLLWDTSMIFPGLKEGEKIRVEKIIGKRGEIRDRAGNFLAMNGVVADVGIVPGKFDNSKISKEQIAKILDMQAAQIDKKLTASYVKPDMFVPMKVISHEEREKIDELLKIKGILVNEKKARVYPLKEKAAHLTGYVQGISAEELKKLENEGYDKDDLIGKTGLEKIYENVLRCRNGAEIYIQDIDGTKKKTIALKEAVDGQDLRLTIDSNIQSAIYDELKDDAALGVALQPKTGEALALVSTPSYNPNSFVLGISDKEWKELNDNPKKPLSNRFQRTFCPGSTFKPITTAIALKVGKLDPAAVKSITGLKWQKDKSWGNYYVTRVSEYKGQPNLLNALLHSDNIYFAQTALDIGKDTFLSEVKNFGVGEKIPFEFNLFNSQFDTDGTLKGEVQLADSGYGQGEVLMNPIHLAAVFGLFVNEGNIIKPYLNYKDGSPVEIWKEKAAPSNVAKEVLEILGQVVENPEGTGHQAFIKGLPIAGKTGTAEIKLNQEDKKGTELGWFEAVNIDNPKLLVLAMVEDVKDRGGSHYVVPKVAKLFEQFAK